MADFIHTTEDSDGNQIGTVVTGTDSATRTIADTQLVVNGVNTNVTGLAEGTINFEVVDADGTTQTGSLVNGKWETTSSAVVSGYDVFFLGGQSNAYYGTTTDSSDVYPSGVYQMGNVAPNVGLVIPAVEPLDQYSGEKEADAAGPMRTFVEAYIAGGNLAAGREILIVAGARSGWGFGTGHWNEGDLAFEDLVPRILAALAIPGSELKGGFMQMGEAEVPYPTTEFTEKALAFTLAIRRRLFRPYGTFPIVWGEMPPNYVSTDTDAAAIQATINNFDTEQEYTAIASASTPTVLTGMRDSIHYDVVSNRENGNRYYTGYLAALTNVFARSLVSPISDLTVTANNNYNMVCVWSASTTGYPYVASYNVYYKLSTDPTYTLFENTTSLNSTVTGLVDALYDFSVRPVNLEGESADSNIVQEQTLLTVAPTASHLFNYEFENNLNDGTGGTGVAYGNSTYHVDATKGNTYHGVDAVSGVETGKTLVAATSYTFSFWVTATNTSAQWIIGSEETVSHTIGYQSGKIRVGNNANFYLLSATNNISASGTHVIVDYDSSTDVTNLYLDNIFEGTATNVARTADNLIVIGNKDTQANGFRGYLDDVRCYTRVLTAAERTDVFAGTVI